MPNKPRPAFATFDGASAQAFLFDRARKRLTPLPGFPMSGAKKPTFEDNRPRTFSSVGSARSAIEPQSDPEKNLERAFVADVAKKLEALRAKKTFGTLIVSAGPRALGYWREDAPQPLRDATAKEIDRDYSNTHPTALLPIVEEAVRGVIASNALPAGDSKSSSRTRRGESAPPTV